MNVSIPKLARVAELIVNHIEEAGASVGVFEANLDPSPFTEASPGFWEAHLSIHLRYPEDDAEVREGVVARLFHTVPGARLIREAGRMTIWGEVDGIRYYLWGGMSACARVQVGTRTVMKPDPDAPLIEVEEPVFEVRCADEAVAS